MNPNTYLKAIFGAVSAGLVQLGAALTEASAGGSAVTSGEWVAIALAVITTGGAVYGVTNAAPVAVQAPAFEEPLEFPEPVEPLDD